MSRGRAISSSLSGRVFFSRRSGASKSDLAMSRPKRGSGHPSTSRSSTPKQEEKIAFISHRTQDTTAPIAAIDGLLTTLGLVPFVAHRDITPSKAWRSEIKRNLAECSVFIAVLTDGYHKSDWCDQEAGFILSRKDVVVVPINVSLSSYGFLSDYQELRWETGPYVPQLRNRLKLTSCLLDSGVVNRGTMLRGLAHAPNFRSADVVIECLAGGASPSPMTRNEATLLAKAVVINDQVHRNMNGKQLLPPLLEPHRRAFEPGVESKLKALGFLS